MDALPLLDLVRVVYGGCELVAGCNLSSASNLCAITLPMLSSLSVQEICFAGTVRLRVISTFRVQIQFENDVCCMYLCVCTHAFMYQST